MKNRNTHFEEIQRLCIEKLDFLEKDFGFKVVNREEEPYGVFITYQNSTTAVRISFEPREGGVFLLLSRLVEGKVPPYPIIVGENTALNSFYLDDLVALRAPSLEFSFRKAKMSSVVQIESAVNEIGGVLRKFASDILMGDFSIFKELAVIVKNRQRNIADKRVTH